MNPRSPFLLLVVLASACGETNFASSSARQTGSPKKPSATPVSTSDPSDTMPPQATRAPTSDRQIPEPQAAVTVAEPEKTVAPAPPSPSTKSEPGGPDVAPQAPGTAAAPAGPAPDQGANKTKPATKSSKCQDAGVADPSTLPVVEISTPEAFLAMDQGGAQVRYLLVRDLDLSGIVIDPKRRFRMPPRPGTQPLPDVYVAELDGDGHRVRGLSYDFTDREDRALGLVGGVKCGVIRNIVFSDFAIGGNSPFVGLMGAAIYDVALVNVTFENGTIAALDATPAPIESAASERLFGRRLDATVDIDSVTVRGVTLRAWSEP